MPSGNKGEAARTYIRCKPSTAHAVGVSSIRSADIKGSGADVVGITQKDLLGDTSLLFYCSRTMVRQTGKKKKGMPTRSSPRKVKKARTTTTPPDTDSGEAAEAAAVAAVVDQPVAPASPAAEGSDGEASEGPAEASEEPEGPPQAPSRGRKRQVKKGADRKQYTVSEEHEDDLLEWLRENEYLWRKGHRQYRDTKKKQAAWREKADSLGYLVEVLLGWWKHIHSWYGKLHLKKSGQAAVKLTDREKYIMATCSFLEGEVRHRGVAPLRPVPLTDSSQPSTSQQAAPTSEATSAPALPLVANLEEQVDDDALLSQMEEQAAANRCQPTPPSSSSSRGRRQRGRLEGQDDSVLLEIRDTMKTSTELLSQLVDLDRGSSARKPFITYVSQTLRDMPEAEYQVMKQKMTALLHNPQSPAEARPTKSRSAPPLQTTPQPLKDYQQPVTYQGYDYQQNSQVQANLQRQQQMPQTPFMTQLQTRQPQQTHPNPSSTPQAGMSSENLSSVLGLTSHVLDDGSLNLTGLSQISDTNMGVLNTPPPLNVSSRPTTPRQHHTNN